ncbi:hypothetical protein F2Q70_00002886 [Brassica cretica]|uniref:Uncharacterized protein n=1 Tax=Brassica cretica TaxID=69181 RepID=A0A8S9IQ95_BRACR|nr:hypothetical protein F2Q70_00002886 [Brassica cretica]
MSNTPYHGKEISADTYTALTRHQFNLESLGERLQRIENTTAAMKDKWRRGDEAMRDFIGTWFNKRKGDMDTCFPKVPVLNITSQNTSKVKLNDYNKALSHKKKKDPSRRLPYVSTDANKSTSIDISSPASSDNNILESVEIYSGLEPKLTCNTKPDTTTSLGAWYTWDRTLQTSLEGSSTSGVVLFSTGNWLDSDHSVPVHAHFEANYEFQQLSLESWFNKRKEEMDTCFPTSPSSQHY